MEKLEDIRDIKPIFELSDYYLYIGALLFFLLVLIAAGIFAYRYFKKKKIDMRGEYIEKLKKINLDDSKRAAYEMTKYLRLIASSSDENEMAESIIRKLEIYKYAKDVPSLSRDIKSDYENFLKAADERNR